MQSPSLLGIPFDGKSSFMRGAAGGPAAIRHALMSLSSNSWSESGVDVALGGLIHDAGDVRCDSEYPRSDIERAVASEHANGRSVIALGGDHSVSYPLISATAQAHSDITVLHFDAHADLYPEFEGDRYSHACPFARVMEDGLVKHLIQVGIRTLSGVQREQIARFGVEVIDMRAWTADERPTVRGPVYVSIDLDVFDPAFAPGVSHHEPGGLTSRDVIDVVQHLTGPIVGADVVELNPSRDPLGISAMLAAKLVKELAAHGASGR